MEILIDGKKTYFELSENFEEQSKQKDVIIFLHGWGGSTLSFRNTFNYLSNFYPCVNLDFWGFGQSEQPNQDFDLKDYAKQVIEIIKWLNIKSVVIVAHSFGGRVALKMIQNKIGCIKKFVFVDIAGLKPRFSLGKFIKIKKYKFTKFLVRHKLKNSKCLTKYGSMDYKLMDEKLKNVFNKIVNEYFENEFAQINQPVLIIWGKNDKDTPLYMAKKLNNNIKNSKLKLLNGGHFAYLENNIFFNESIKQFIGE